VVKLAVVIMFS